MTKITLNRFHRLALWCKDCDNYWQQPNYLVVLHGNVDAGVLKRLLKANLYLYHELFELDVDETFGKDYVFAKEVNLAFEEVKRILEKYPREIIVLDIDVLDSMNDNLSGIIEFIVGMKDVFDGMAVRVLENSPRNFLNKLKVIRKNMLKSLEADDLKSVIDNMMDLNIAGLDSLVQCVGMVFNCTYALLVDMCDPEEKVPGVLYCKDANITIERLSSISGQSFLYKYKRRWLIFYRELLRDCKPLFLGSSSNLKLYEELQQCGNYETIENVLFDLLITKNPEMSKQVSYITRHQAYPKTTSEIYGFWDGRSKEQKQKIYSCLDSCLPMDKKSTLLPFILAHKEPPTQRLFFEIKHMVDLFSTINPELSINIALIRKIFPNVFAQTLFPDRERYEEMALKSPGCSTTIEDPLDNIRDKNTLRKCENAKCQKKNNGQRVVWNLNTFELGNYNMNSIFKEFIKNPTIFKEIFEFAQKNYNIAINPNNPKGKKVVVVRK